MIKPLSTSEALVVHGKPREEIRAEKRTEIKCCHLPGQGLHWERNLRFNHGGPENTIHSTDHVLRHALHYILNIYL